MAAEAPMVVLRCRFVVSALGGGGREIASFDAGGTDVL